MKGDRFTAKYIINNDTGCWNWTAALNSNGYGVFGVNPGRAMLAHRYSFLISNGFLPVCVCHRCDNKKCVNPDHLFGGSYLDNTKDAISKGRHRNPPHPKGFGHPRSKSTQDQNNIIRGTKGVSQRKLSIMFGLSQRTIGRILSHPYDIKLIQEVK